MPIYEYVCNQCAHRVDLLQSMDEAEATLCPACHAHALSKLISAPAFHLKGSGWYVTDFKNPTAAPATTQTDASSAPTAENKTATDTSNKTNTEQSAAPATAPQAADTTATVASKSAEK